MSEVVNKINRSLDNKQLAKYLSTQLNNFFPDNYPVDSNELLLLINKAEDRVYHCFSNIRKKYFHENGVTNFNHLISDQYCMYLYMLANHIHTSDGDAKLPTKLYYLNKALHAVDIYYGNQLPDIFLLVHPVGTVLGRGNFSDYLVVYQGCTVGCLNDGVFPEFEGPAIMYANSTVLGNCTIGKNVCFAAGSYVANENVSENKVVLGKSPNLILRDNNKNIEQRPPYCYGK